MRKCLLLLTVALLALTACTGGSHHPSPAPSAAGPYESGPVRPPATGALLGAWVRPITLSQPDRIAAVDGLEATLGRPLDIVTTYRRIDEQFPTASDRAFADGGATLMLSWAFDDTQTIASGAEDAVLHDWARRIGGFGAPILLRFRWEMDRPNLAGGMHSPADFIAAWRHTRSLFEADGVRNVSWVWCPTVEGFAGGYAQPFYPGDDQVDWNCVDVYAGTHLTPLSDLLRPFLGWAAAHPRPIVVGEFGVARAWGSTARAAWLSDAAAAFRSDPQIKAVSYFDSDPDETTPKRQFEIDDDPAALAAFAALAREPYFDPRQHS